jgi:hypothetical protein
MNQPPHPADDDQITEADGQGHVEEAANDEPSQSDQLLAGMAALLQIGMNGANWYFWVAGLSLVNSAIMLSGGDTHFVIGLGITFMADIMANVIGQQHPEHAQMLKLAVLGFDLIVAAVVIGFAFLSRKRFLFIFGLGMFLYLLDGLIFVWIQDWMSVAFHAYALYGLWGGLNAFRQLKQVEQTLLLSADPQPA